MLGRQLAIRVRLLGVNSPSFVQSCFGNRVFRPHCHLLSFPSFDPTEPSSSPASCSVCRASAPATTFRSFDTEAAGSEASESRPTLGVEGASTRRLGTPGLRLA